jgi:hypothetical protein
MHIFRNNFSPNRFCKGRTDGIWGLCETAKFIPQLIFAHDQKI